MSPSDYIHQLRIQDAKRILMESSKPVIQIAEEVGYNNDQSFLRAFKKWVGMSRRFIVKREIHKNEPSWEQK